MLTDSHCHLASHRFADTTSARLIDSASAAGVSRMVTLATRLEDLSANLALAEHPSVHACLGIHPCDVHLAPDDAIARIEEHTNDPRVCGIGETGLDYFHPAPDGWNESDFRSRQQSFLRQHFALAARCGLNVVIHTRDREGDASFRDALAIYRDFHADVRAVFHCFIADYEHADEVIRLGGLVSFGGVATFKSAVHVRDCARQCPAGSFMIETDAPYLAPEPRRGQRNEPSFVRHTAEFLATLRGEPLESLAAHTSETANRFFRFRSATK